MCVDAVQLGPTDDEIVQTLFSHWIPRVLGANFRRSAERL